jgi:hypothetical protein
VVPRHSGWSKNLQHQKNRWLDQDELQQRKYSGDILAFGIYTDNTNCDCNPHGDANSHANGHSYRYSNSDANDHADGNTYSYRYSNSHADGNT